MKKNISISETKFDIYTWIDKLPAEPQRMLIRVLDSKDLYKIIPDLDNYVILSPSGKFRYIARYITQISIFSYFPQYLLLSSNTYPNLLSIFGSRLGIKMDGCTLEHIEDMLLQVSAKYDFQSQKFRKYFESETPCFFDSMPFYCDHLPSCFRRPFWILFLSLVYIRRITRVIDGKALTIERGKCQSLEFTSPSVPQVICDTDGNKILMFTKYATMDETGWREAKSDDASVSRLNSFIQVIPTMATALEVATGNYMNVQIPSGTELVKSKSGNFFIGALRNLKNGKLHGGLKLDPGKLGDLVSSAVLINLASTLLGQKQMADINRKLSEIKSGIESVGVFQVAERRSVITGSIAYYEQIAQSVFSGDISGEVAASIEANEVKLLQIEHHLDGDIASVQKKLEESKDRELFFYREFKKDIEQNVKKLKIYYTEKILCLKARACGAQLLSAFDGKRLRVEGRMRSIQKSLIVHIRNIETTDKFFRSRANSINGSETRLSIQLDEKNNLSETFTEAQAMQAELDSLINDLLVTQDSLSLDIKINNGQVTAYRLQTSNE